MVIELISQRKAVEAVDQDDTNEAKGSDRVERFLKDLETSDEIETIESPDESASPDNERPAEPAELDLQASAADAGADPVRAWPQRCGW